ncbi:hypothetical protein ABVK25_008638 [Lepraria finkii]|uniref:Apple domain-containing protein n=1 Tax=Lepraria finkii TaxID=1340010 RepID=A0ABR4AZG9_9LECA
MSLEVLTVSSQSAKSAESNTTAPSCTSPTGFANTMVFAPEALATINYQISGSFEYTHFVYFTEIPNTDLSQANIASFCLDQCIAYQGNSISNLACLSFSADMGAPYHPMPAIRLLDGTARHLMPP